MISLNGVQLFSTPMVIIVFFGLVGHSTYAQRPKKPPNPFLMVATGIAYTVIVLTS
jgi:hypothetical protein